MSKEILSSHKLIKFNKTKQNTKLWRKTTPRTLNPLYQNSNFNKSKKKGVKPQPNIRII